MSRSRTLRLSIAPSVALAALVVAGLLAPAPAAALDLNSALLVTSRTRLEICVDGDSVGLNGRRAAVAETRARLSQISTHARWTIAGYDRAPVSVIEGCPDRGALIARGLAHESNRGPAEIFVTDQPSRFRLFVIVTTRESIAAIFGDGPNTVAAQESMCVPVAAPTDCFEVTTALYVDQAQLRDPAFTRGLLMGIGLEPTVPRIDDPRIQNR